MENSTGAASSGKGVVEVRVRGRGPVQPLPGVAALLHADEVLHVVGAADGDGAVASLRPVAPQCGEGGAVLLSLGLGKDDVVSHEFADGGGLVECLAVEDDLVALAADGLEVVGALGLGLVGSLRLVEGGAARAVSRARHRLVPTIVDFGFCLGSGDLHERAGGWHERLALCAALCALCGSDEGGRLVLVRADDLAGGLGVDEVRALGLHTQRRAGCVVGSLRQGHRVIDLERTALAGHDLKPIGVTHGRDAAAELWS
mmetsp:Transcript_15637/g.37307  ORF Transcript_15637/g.37307 Transcript_15637/m.37307 type:complete len:258 (-) Transcript_15637:599-1372(-)